MSVTQLSAIELKRKLMDNPALFLLDVREPDEFRFAHITGSVLIPLKQIPERFGELDKGHEIVVICHHGMRSQQAAHYLVHVGFTQVANLQGGIDAWSRDCDPAVRRY